MRLRPDDRTFYPRTAVSKPRYAAGPATHRHAGAALHRHASAAAALDRLCDPAARVSAHYVVEEDGTVGGSWPRRAAPFMPGCRAGKASVTSISCRSASRSSIPAMNGVTARSPNLRWRRSSGCVATSLAPSDTRACASFVIPTSPPTAKPTPAASLTGPGCPRRHRNLASSHGFGRKRREPISAALADLAAIGYGDAAGEGFVVAALPTAFSPGVGRRRHRP